MGMNPSSHQAESVMGDEELVAGTLAGDRESFQRIVERYQTLICSVAYNATGSLAASEDLAQETFIAGWKQIGQLREPAGLRRWLCGIVNNLIKNRRRRLAAEPVHVTAAVSVQEIAATEAGPSDVAIRREQEAMLWQALERVPENYRQPLILFYREHQSIARVAHALDLSEEVVRQRLSRGRRLLQQQVMTWVEDTLARTTPGTMFTMSVMAALPLLASASLTTASTAAGVAAQASVVGLGAKLLLAVNVVIGPVVMLLAAWLGVSESLANARSPAERRLVQRHFLALLGAAIAFTLVSIPLNARAKADGGLTAAPMLVWFGLLLGYLAGVAVLAVRWQRQQRRMRREGIAASSVAPRTALAAGHEFRSRWTLLGLPLVHVRLNTQAGGAEPPAVGWIAIGNYAVGILFAWGGVAVGAVSGGGIAAGLVSIGAVSVGGLALGGLALGVYAMGGVAAGLVATGAFAFGWLGAEGRYAIARAFALGVHAAATHANDGAAQAFFAERPWFDLRATAGRATFALVWLPALATVSHYLWRRRAEQHARSR